MILCGFGKIVTIRPNLDQQPSFRYLITRYRYHFQSLPQIKRFFSPDPVFVPYGTLGRRVTKAPLEFSANPLKHKTGSCLYGTPAARKIPIFGHQTKLAIDKLCVCKLLAAYDINLPW